MTSRFSAWLTVSQSIGTPPIKGGEPIMNWDTRKAAVIGVIGAVPISAAAVTDAVVQAVTGQHCDPEVSCWAPLALIDWAHIVGFAALFVAAMAVRQRYTAQLGRVGRVAAVAMPVAFAFLTLGFLAGTLHSEWTGVLEAIGTIAFLGMFIVGLVLGVSLWRRTEASRVPVFLLIAPLPLLLPLVVVLELVGAVPGHPAALEAALYLGVATLAYERISTRGYREARQEAVAG